MWKITYWHCNSAVRSTVPSGGDCRRFAAADKRTSRGMGVRCSCLNKFGGNLLGSHRLYEKIKRELPHGCLNKSAGAATPFKFAIYLTLNFTPIFLSAISRQSLMSSSLIVPLTTDIVTSPILSFASLV